MQPFPSRLLMIGHLLLPDQLLPERDLYRATIAIQTSSWVQYSLDDKLTLSVVNLGI